MPAKGHRLPTFIYIGPDKAGSTWLYHVLRSHPQCFVPELKDIYFFDRFYHRGMTWYLSFFRGATSEHRAVGEFSHDYLFSSIAAERIRRHLPNVQLLTCLRNPVERTFSHYLQLVRSGITRDRFRDALRKYPILLEHSRYSKYLKVYYDVFPQEQLRILRFDDLEADPSRFAIQIFDLLGLDHTIGINLSKKVLPASRPRNLLVARLAKISANLLRQARLERFLGLLKASSFWEILYRPYSPDEKPRLSPDDKRLLAEMFREDVQHLARLTGMSYDCWTASWDV